MNEHIGKMEKNKTAQEGEDKAAEYLEKRGMEILARNWRYGHSEIDLIVRDGERIVFIEVKTRRTLKFGFPETAVKEGKKKAIFRASEEYIYKSGHKGEIRFDIIAVILEKKLELLHLKDAFFPTGY